MRKFSGRRNETNELNAPIHLENVKICRPNQHTTELNIKLSIDSHWMNNKTTSITFDPRIIAPMYTFSHQSNTIHKMKITFEIIEIIILRLVQKSAEYS